MLEHGEQHENYWVVEKYAPGESPAELVGASASP